MNAVVTALNVYPLKGGRGIAHEAVTVGVAGFEHDRRWLAVTPDGRFISQREHPRLALLRTSVADDALTLSFPDGATMVVPAAADGPSRSVTVWKDRCAGRDCGDAVADAVSRLVGAAVRVVEFDASVPRLASADWTGDVVAPVRFADGYPILLLSEESLDDLNARLPAPLPMNRFRPNLVVRGLGAFGEDRVRELRIGALRLRPVKPCTRCTVTTTDQITASVDAAEPLRTLKTFRWDRELRGVTFGQNVVIAGGVGSRLAVGDALDVEWR